MNDWQVLTQKLKQFADDRDWAQFHNAKDLALALSIETSELNELFLWKKAEEADPEKVKEELADIFAYALQLAAKFDFDVNQMVLDKIEKNAAKYPVDRSKGNARKYTEL